MSTDALFWALRLETVQGDPYSPKRPSNPDALTAPEKTVLLHLADHADNVGECFPSVAFLSKKTGIAESSVRKYLRRLEERELIFTTERTATNGRRSSSLYRLALPDLQGPVRLLAMEPTHREPVGTPSLPTESDGVPHREPVGLPTESEGDSHREPSADPPGAGGSSITSQVNQSKESISGNAGAEIESQGLDVWWGPIDAELKRRSRPGEYAGLFADLRPVSIEDGAVTVFPPNQYVGEKVQASIFFWRILKEIAPDVPVKIQDVSI